MTITCASLYAKLTPESLWALRSALQQPQIEIDINSTFVLDAKNEVWELNSEIVINSTFK